MVEMVGDFGEKREEIGGCPQGRNEWHAYNTIP